MLNPDDKSKRSSIYINPNFRRNTIMTNIGIETQQETGTTRTVVKPHFNPVFLNHLKQMKIHLNPDFFQNQLPKPVPNEFSYLPPPPAPTAITTTEPIHSQLSIIPNGVSTTNSDSKNFSSKCDVKTAPVTLTNSPTILPAPKYKLVSKSRTHLVREPLQQPKTPAIACSKAPIVHITRCKLIRVPATTSKRHASIKECIENIATNVPKSTNKKLIPTTASRVGRYKVDRRPLKIQTLSKISGNLRSSLQQKPGAPNAISRIFNKHVSKRNSTSFNKKLELLNINGMLYKCTRNKLQRKSVCEIKPIAPTAPKCSKESIKTVLRSKPIKGQREQAIFISGTKFVMDSTGFKLIRVPVSSTSAPLKVPTKSYGSKYKKDNSHPSSPLATFHNQYCDVNLGTKKRQRNRIDIGGLTYIASSHSNDVYVQTKTHLALAHLNNAKQKSIQLLRKSYKLNNLPCKIFQRLGRCAALQRGRCNKVHDKNQVAICANFLRGECMKTASECLLSHNISYSKMPVCRFFLQGMCVRDDCPYLHKKLNNDAKICVDFQRGYCELGEKCTRLHEFVKSSLSLPKHSKAKLQKNVNEKLKATGEGISSTPPPPPPPMKQQPLTEEALQSDAPEDTVQLSRNLRYFNNLSSDLSDAEVEVEVDSAMDVENDDVSIEDSPSPSASNEDSRKRKRLTGSLPEFVSL